jgi:hypothetical protein
MPHQASTPTDNDAPGLIRLPHVESQARFIASIALTAIHGYPPPARYRPYLSPQLFQRLTARAKTHVVRSRPPSYSGRAYLCRINQHIIEATVTASDGVTTRAVAIRLEQTNGLWRAHELAII